MSIYLEGAKAPVESEITAFDLDVTGDIPQELEGRWLRNVFETGKLSGIGIVGLEAKIWLKSFKRNHLKAIVLEVRVFRRILR